MFVVVVAILIRDGLDLSSDSAILGLSLDVGSLAKNTQI